MRVEYFDYYLLYTTGRGRMKVFNEYHVDNSMPDFLLKKQEAGCMRHFG